MNSYEFPSAIDTLRWRAGIARAYYEQLIRYAELEGIENSPYMLRIIGAAAVEAQKAVQRFEGLKGSEKD